MQGDNPPIVLPSVFGSKSVVTSEGVVIVVDDNGISIFEDFTLAEPTTRINFESRFPLDDLELSADERYLGMTGCYTMGMMGGCELSGAQIWDWGEGILIQESEYAIDRAITYLDMSFHPSLNHYAISGMGVPDDSGGEQAISAIEIWEVGINEPVRTLSFPNATIYVVQYDQSGERLVVIKEGAISVVDAHSGDILADVSADNPAFALGLSPDDNTLALIRWGGLSLWDMESNNEITSNIGHSGLIVDVLFSPDDRLLASASWDRTARLWDIETGELLFTVEGDDWFGPLAFNASGTVWLVSVDATLTAWDIDPESETFETMLTEVREISAITQIGQSADYETIATGTMVGTVMVRSVELDNVLATFATSQDMIPAIDMNDDATLVAYWQSNQMHLRDIANDVAMTSIAFDTVAQQARFSPTQPIVALATDCLHLWYYETGELIGIEGVENLATVAFSPDGALLVAGNNTGAIHVIDVATREVLVSLHRQYNVRTVAFSHDGTMIASAGEDGSVMIWAVD